jgi:hypothetical protein
MVEIFNKKQVSEQTWKKYKATFLDNESIVIVCMYFHELKEKKKKRKRRRKGKKRKEKKKEEEKERRESLEKNLRFYFRQNSRRGICPDDIKSTQNDAK